VLVNPDRFESRVEEVAFKKASASAAVDADADADSSSSLAGEGGDGDGASGCGDNAGGVNCFGSTFPGAERAIQQGHRVENGDEEREMLPLPSAPPTVEAAGHAAAAAAAAAAYEPATVSTAAAPTPTSAPKSPWPADTKTLQQHQQGSLPLQAGGMAWPPSPTMKVGVACSMLDLCGGMPSGAGAASVRAGGAGAGVGSEARLWAGAASPSR